MIRSTMKEPSLAILLTNSVLTVGDQSPLLRKYLSECLRSLQGIGEDTEKLQEWLEEYQIAPKGVLTELFSRTSW